MEEEEALIVETRRREPGAPQVTSPLSTAPEAKTRDSKNRNGNGCPVSIHGADGRKSRSPAAAARKTACTQSKAVSFALQASEQTVPSLRLCDYARPGSFVEIDLSRTQFLPFLHFSALAVR